ncbi:aldo/keto reductase [Lentilactobacillus hilgardii]|uniref:Oxidoreductase, aldo/keto reductase family protein n=1 Tax=Lentilactobacillus hilgardii (strain ATCC 8290 / DSM 20176 / CCUG 30140 / JCM 1155 / KCTC 3500 / NBRC 15886 / NCIMB 8040 / NRRL B-1843 / 9) TaxID=1423757 RepID=C0XIS3_LENH9|nr:aldo/keto reductase [Lentilactobacillus hilgardii]EEI24734.1 oxidoreductase, aldo/keto reductase family protein [Lentilactobacillus hilgardii DSM 20176 = ATCC 8290]KRK57600.1 dehydrogenase [Lentilactobacillus hilgardii DSM 20176 = ATCC 8290]MCP9333491.1 aldo/keto reductase [Lentilactobacillus hilgardii]MCP9350068.1 aldo/keto reductase [Lentilactobacillus hilgardii]MCP9352966.1 aldo/keto reductase [Lentilactobacillus hilgardii]
MAQRIKIGKSTVTTTPLGLGTNKVGGHNLFDGLKDEDGVEVVKAALEDGISLLDTAYMYGLGKSEEIIGNVTQDYDRSKFVIATKAAQDPNNDLKPNNDPKFLKKSVDDALQRLQTDYIDIFYIHFPDDKTPKAEAVQALAEEKKAGKIKAIGVSNFSLDQIKEANADNQVDIVEDNYSLVHREAEKEEFPYLKEHQISFVPYFPLSSGLLTGKYTPADNSKFSRFSSKQYTAIMAALEKVKAIAVAHQATVAQTILAWYIKNQNISVVIPGARVADQVHSNAQAMDITISDDEFKQIDQLFKQF